MREAPCCLPKDYSVWTEGPGVLMFPPACSNFELCHQGGHRKGRVSGIWPSLFHGLNKKSKRTSNLICRRKFWDKEKGHAPEAWSGIDLSPLSPESLRNSSYIKYLCNERVQTVSEVLLQWNLVCTNNRMFCIWKLFSFKL